jgi:outer membrane protein assembly factor BamE (lipoprotein component of BamABCDE complex)
MKPGSRRLSSAAAGFALLGLASCSPPVETRGNIPDAVVIGEIKPGVHTKDQVSQLLGTPSSVATFDKNTWYYLGRKTESVAFFKPETIEAQTVVIRFDDKGVVSEIRRLDRESGREIDVVERETPTRGKELNFVRAILGSMGFLGRNPLSGEAAYKKEGRD